jgi:hypothetical protein
MSDLEKVREWADNNDLKVQAAQDGTKWTLSVDLESPIRFRASSAWQESMEAAAAKLLDQLRVLGEDVD